jgi:intein/homing endonuclease
MKFPSTAQYDSIYIQQVDTLSIAIPGDTVKVISKVPCDDFELITENGRLLQELKVVNGILQSKITIKPDTIFRFVTNTITKVKEIKVPERIKYVPKFYKIMSLIGGGMILSLLVWVWFKIKR